MPTPATAKWARPKSADEWEDMVLDALRLNWDDRGATRNGRQGQAQHGVDIFGHADGAPVGAQVKNTETLTDAVIAEEIAAAEDFTPRITQLVFVISGHRDAKIQERIRNLSEERAANSKFRIDVLFFEDVCQFLCMRPDLVRKHWADFAGPRGLRVVDVSTNDLRPPTEIDVKLRNTGFDICYITRASLRILEVGVIQTLGRRFSQKTVSCVYDATFDPRRTPPYDLVVPVSQVIGPNDADRFQINIICSDDFESLHVETTLVQATLRLVHDEDNSTTEPVDLLFTIPPPRIIFGTRGFHDEGFASRVAENSAVLRRMLALPGRTSPEVDRLREREGKRV